MTYIVKLVKQGETKEVEVEAENIKAAFEDAVKENPEWVATIGWKKGVV